MKTFKVSIEGIRPLIMSNPQTVDVTNHYSAESRRLNNAMKAARKKQDEDRLIELAMEQKTNDFMASAYFDDAEKKFFMPDSVILACIREAAKTLKKAKDIDRCVLMEETHAYVSGIPPVKTLEEAEKNPQFSMETPAKIPPRTGALFMKRRCIMPTGWKANFTLTFDEQQIAKTTLQEILRVAGAFVGIGGWRPKFGRFVVEVKE